MGKPRLIILIRHAQSEGNKNRAIHQTTPDHRVKLTPEGWKQAIEAGRKLRSLLRPDDTLHFYTSPYRRTRETTEGILSTLTADTPTPSPFPRNTIKVYEEPRLREQDFGNFQPCSAEMTRMWEERADYGHFFYRIPNGESAADAYDRVSGFNESLWRSFGEDDFASVCVLVTHGLMTRVFLMKWYHWSVEYFEDLRNINHCEFIVMQKNRDNGKYVLKNQLRTWTQYKQEREEEQRRQLQNHNSSSSNNINNSSKEGGSNSPIPTRKRWGGCPDGCDHSELPRTRPPRRQNTADLFRDDGVTSMQQLEAAMQKKSLSNNSSTNPKSSSSGSGTSCNNDNGNAAPPSYTSSRGRGNSLTVKAGRAALADIPDTPTPTLNGDPSRLLSPNRLAVLRAGRDGGGSESGNGSRVGSDEEEDDNGEDHTDDGESGIGSGRFTDEPDLPLTPDIREDVENPMDKNHHHHHPASPITSKNQASPPPFPLKPSRTAKGKQQYEEETEEHRAERARQFRPIAPRSMAQALAGVFDEEEGKSAAGGGRMADALGDQSEASDASEGEEEEGGEEEDHEAERVGEREKARQVEREVDALKREEGGFEGSVL